MGTEFFYFQPLGPGFKVSNPIYNKHFESSQKLLKSSFVNEIFGKYSKIPIELLTFETTKFTKTFTFTEICVVYICTVIWFCVQLYCKLVLHTAVV